MRLAAVIDTLTIDQDAVLHHPVFGFVMADDAIVTQIIIGLGRFRHEGHAAFGNLIGRGVQITRPDGDMLDALAIVASQVFDNLPGLAPVLVDRDANAPTGAGQSAAAQPGELALDIKNRISRKLNRSP